MTGEVMVKHGQVQRFLRPVFLALIIFGLMGQPLQAIGPGTGGSKIRVNDEDIGPFTLLVATSPLPVTAGQMSVWVRVTGKEDQKLRRDAVVTIKATPREGGETFSTQGTHQSAGNDFDYVGHLAVEQSGQWDVTITVVDDLGDAEVVFTESVTRGRSGSALLVLAIPFVIVAVAVGIFLWRRSAAA